MRPMSPHDATDSSFRVLSEVPSAPPTLSFLFQVSLSLFPHSDARSPLSTRLARSSPGAAEVDAANAQLRLRRINRLMSVRFFFLPSSPPRSSRHRLWYCKTARAQACVCVPLCEPYAEPFSLPSAGQKTKTKTKKNQCGENVP